MFCIKYYTFVLNMVFYYISADVLTKISLNDYYILCFPQDQGVQSDLE